jgi:hypothetical protein
LFDRLHFSDLARHLLLASRELGNSSRHLFLTGRDPLDTARHLLLTGGHPVNAMRHLLLTGSDAGCDPVNALPHLIKIERYCVELLLIGGWGRRRDRRVCIGSILRDWGRL